MWGAGSGCITRLLDGGRIRVDEIHPERNPYFGGVNPEPIRPNIDEALGILRRRARPRPVPRWRRRPGGRRFGHAAAAPVVHGTLKLLDDADIAGELALREVRTGRVETIQDWGRPESFRQEFRRLRSQ